MASSRIYLLPVVAILALTSLIGIAQPRQLYDLGAFVFDTWQRIDPRAFEPDRAVKIVVVDEDSLATLGQWPWPRTRLAEATGKLGALGAAAIAFDIVFAETDRTSLEAIVSTLPEGATRKLLTAELPVLRTNDQTFLDALSKTNAVLGATLLARGSPSDLAAKAGFVVAGDQPDPFIARFRSAAAPLPMFRAEAKGIGATNWLPDHDQVIRRVPLLVRLDDRLIPALSVEALRVAQDASTIIVRASNASGEVAFGRASGVNALKVGDIQVATGANADVRPYYTRSNAQRFIPIGRLLAGKVDRSDIDGRIILVGTTAIGLGDVRATPLDAAVPGVEIQAQVIESILGGVTLDRPDWASGAELAVALALGLLVALTLPRLPPLAAALLVLGAVAACFTVSFAAFKHEHVLVDPSLPSLSTFGVYLAGTLALWRAERIAKRNVRAAFGKFLAPTVVDRLAADPRGLVLGGETRVMTVMFSDIRNFARLSETMDAAELTRYMNAYLTPMTDAILDHQGTVDKYIGDAIVAFWNAPLDIPGHEAQAVRAALAMRGKLAAFNATREAQARGTGQTYSPTINGIGLNVGPCTVGNLGSLRRFDYSVLGDPVNLGARLEGLSKLYNVDIIASEAIVSAAPEFAWLEIDRVRVKGRSGATVISTLVGDESFAVSAGFVVWRQTHGSMLDAYRAADFDAAVAIASTLSTTTPAQWHALYSVLADWFRRVAETPHRSDLFPIRVLDAK